jgi:hypothetical protein
MFYTGLTRVSWFFDCWGGAFRAGRSGCCLQGGPEGTSEMGWSWCHDSVGVRWRLQHPWQVRNVSSVTQVALSFQGTFVTLHACNHQATKVAGSQLQIITFHHVPSFSIMFRHCPSCSIICCHAPSPYFFIMFHHFPFCSIIFHHVSSFPIISVIFNNFP